MHDCMSRVFCSISWGLYFSFCQLSVDRTINAINYNSYFSENIKVVGRSMDEINSTHASNAIKIMLLPRLELGLQKMFIYCSIVC